MASSTRQWQKQRGFTLLELMVVAFILVLLAGTVVVLVIKRADDAKHAKAVADIEAISNALDQYRLQNGDYPADLDALVNKPAGEDLPNWDGPYIKKQVPNDPWNHPYAYVVPGEHNPKSYDLSTLGSDAKEGGTGNDADITNW